MIEKCSHWLQSVGVMAQSGKIATLRNYMQTIPTPLMCSLSQAFDWIKDRNSLHFPQKYKLFELEFTPQTQDSKIGVKKFDVTF